MIKDLSRCQIENLSSTIVWKYWMMFCSCSGRGRGPGPGPGSRKSFRPHSSGPGSGVLLWVYIFGITWLSCTIVGCKNDELLVSSCDFSKLERLAAAAASDFDDSQLNEISAPNMCNYTKLNYYDFAKNENNFTVHRKRLGSLEEEQKQQQQQSKINSLRLEAIKHQILTKLGLKSKPNVTNTLSKEFVLETLRRAGETRLYSYNYHQNPPPDIYYIEAGGQPSYKVTSQFYQSQQYDLYNKNQPEQAIFPYPYRQQSDNAAPEDELMAADDYYGRTREIIAFAAKGKLLNGQRLLEFSMTPDDRSANQDLRIRSATLWAKVDLRQGGAGKFRRKKPLNADKRLTLWIFRLVEPFETYGGGYLNEKDFDRATDLIALHYIDAGQFGWQQIDLTAALKTWYTDTGGKSKKLRLLIDCSGCGDRVEIHLFNSAPPPAGYRSKLNTFKSNHHQQHHHHNHHLHNHYTVNSNKNNIYNANNQFDLQQKSTKDNNHIFHTPDLETDNANSQDNEKEQSEVNRPFLVVHLDPYRMKRVRRRALDCSGALKGQCCKQRFYVSFKELGWDDWILAPPGYEANYCRGDCGGLYRTPDLFGSMHTHFIEEYRKSDKLDGMQPCCAPTKFSSMSIIYYGPDEKIIKQDLPKMVVDECGCP